MLKIATQEYDFLNVSDYELKNQKFLIHSTLLIILKKLC